MHVRDTSLAGLACVLCLLLPAVSAATGTPAGKGAPAPPAHARTPAGAGDYIAAIRSARSVYVYRLNTAAGLLDCDSLEGSGPGLGCPAVVRRWTAGGTAWVESLATLLSQPDAWEGSEKTLVSYPDLALRFEGDDGWSEMILDTGYRQFWLRAGPWHEPVVGLYDRVLDAMNALIRSVLPADMSLDAQGVLTGPARPLATDYPNRNAPTEIDATPERVYFLPLRCPAALGRPCGADSVQLRVWIGKDGRVHAVQPLAGDPLLLEAASAASRDWVFRPAIFNRQPVAAWTDVWVGFAPAR